MGARAARARAARARRARAPFFSFLNSAQQVEVLVRGVEFGRL